MSSSFKCTFTCPTPYTCSPSCTVGGQTTPDLFVNFVPAAYGAPNQGQGDQAYMLLMTALVMIMTPGVAFFYGGLVSDSAVVNAMMLSFGTMGVVTICWALIG